MQEYGITFNGKPIDKMTREELVGVVESLYADLREQQRRYADEYNKLAGKFEKARRAGRGEAES